MKFLGKLLLFAIIAVVAGGAWMFLMEGQSTSGVKAGAVTKDEKKIYSQLVAVEPAHYADNYGMLRVYGSVKNLGPEVCSYAKLEIELRNKDDKLVKTLKVTVKDIEPNTTKSFDVNGGSATSGIILKSRIAEASFIKR